MAELSVDIIVYEILTRMPTRAVGRSKCVCKKWYSLLSTQDFIRVHCSRSSISCNQRFLLFENETCIVHQINIQSGDCGPSNTVPIKFNTQYGFKILSHLDGLLLLSVDRDCTMKYNISELLLWNPVTTAYKYLQRSGEPLWYEDGNDIASLYIDANDEYKVLHITRRRDVLNVLIYSMRVDTWREIPLTLSFEYGCRNFNISAGTLCGRTLYFTVCDCAVGGINVVIDFDVNSEEFKEINFPPVPATAIYHGALVNVKNKLHMFLSSGYKEMAVTLWMLGDEHWTQLLYCRPLPLIPLDLWCEITHYVSNGTKWFVMSDLRKLFEIETDTKASNCLYHSSRSQWIPGAMFLETIVSPTL